MLKEVHQAEGKLFQLETGIYTEEQSIPEIRTVWMTWYSNEALVNCFLELHMQGN